MNKLLFLMMCFVSISLTAQVKVTGTVSDESGSPLPGVNIVVKGTTKGVVSDFDGNYEIQAKQGDVLEFTFLGFESQTRRVTGGGKSMVINVVLAEDAQQLEETVVVGQGAIKKVAVTGAITSVKGSDLRIPSSSLTTAFAGQLAGVIAMAKSGQPGSASDFYIRGISTFGGRTTPLIILDDIEISTADLNNIPAETIESFSVLKDASATAIYGSRGANGVMIVKTKTGSKNMKTKVGVTYDQSFNVVSNFPKFVDGATWMELYNEALLTRNPLAPIRYTQQQIDATRNRENPYVYPDVDWASVLFRNWALNHRANINMQGGGDKATYYMSIQANHDEGLLKTKKMYSWDNNISIWAYNFQNNITYSLSDRTTVELRMNAQIRQGQGPNFATAASGDSSGIKMNMDDLFATIRTSNPVRFPAYFPQEDSTHFRFGNAIRTGNEGYTNPYAMLNTGFGEVRENTLNTALKLKQDLDFITKGLSGTLLVNFKNWSYNAYYRWIRPYYYRVKGGTYDPGTQKYELERIMQVGEDFVNTSARILSGDQTTEIQATLDYVRQIGDHNVNAMLLYKQREYKSDVLPQRNQGYSGRFMYNFKNKYFAELNFGYTGTERLAKARRFELFPAASLGWVVSDEKFFKPIEKVVSFVKLRGSYGIIGSDDMALGPGRYLYLDRIALNHQDYGYTTGEMLNYTLRGPKLVSWAIPEATWEKAKKMNVGADLKFFNNRLSVTADYFIEDRYDIFLHREAFPQSLGYHDAKPWANKGKMNNWGYEFAVNWNQPITDDLTLELRGTFTYTQNKIVDRDDPIYKYPWQSQTGKPWSRVDGYIAEGLFSSQEEIDNHADQTQLGSVPKPGDIKYRDITGDGIINSDDQTMISPYGRTPRIQYGFGFNVIHKRFDMNVFFSGFAKRTILTGLNGPFGQNDNNVFQYIADNRWTEANPNPNAEYPRLGLQTSDTDNNNYTSTYWMRDGSFLRFKTLEVGYKFKQGRVYFAADNLAVFSKFDLWDPELQWYNYPLQRTFNMGVQLNF